MSALAELLDERVAVARVKAAKAATEARAASGSTSAQAAADQAVADLDHYVALRDRLDVNRSGPYLRNNSRSFFGDVAQREHDRHAARRLADYLAEQRSTTGDYGGLVVPQYLTDDLVNSGHSGSPLVDYLRRPLPAAGMSLNVPRVTVAATAADQQTQNTAVAVSTPGTDLESAPVHTVSLAFIVAQQVLDRATDAELDVLVAREAVVAVQALQEARVVNGTGANGQPTGLLSETTARTITLSGTDAASALDAIAEAAAAIDAARETPADCVVMAARRWRWLLAAAGDRAAAISTSTGTGPVVGTVLGVPVIASNGVPVALGTSSDEDRIVVLRRGDVVVADTPVRVHRHRDSVNLAGQMTAKLVLDRYYASACVDTRGLAIITGAGTRNPF